MKGWEGWDTYAAFYDWENARTFGRRDVAFWRAAVARERGRILELGCGTGRLLVPLARSGARMTGIDRSEPMLERARTRAKRVPARRRPGLSRGDVRQLPFASQSMAAVIAAYGLLQSLVTDSDVNRALREAARVLRPGGLFGIDLVPDLPAWAEYGPRTQLAGRSGDGATLELVESVRQDRRRGLTIFDERFIERRGRTIRTRRFSLVFRTEPMPRLLRRLAAAGFEAEALLGDYCGTPWALGAEAWLVLARKRGEGAC